MLEEQNQPAQEASAESEAARAASGEPSSDVSSVMGSIASSVAAPDEPPDAAQEPPAGQGDLRPVWPIGERGRGARISRRYALFARLAATASALLLFYVSWAPLADVVTSDNLRVAVTGPMYRFSLTAGELGAPPLHALFGDSFFGLWSVLTVAGLLLSPLLWQTAIRWLQWLAIALYACWLVIMSVIFIATAQLILATIPTLLRSGAGPYVTALYGYDDKRAIYTIAPTFGLWLALLGALLGLAAACFAVMAMVTHRRAIAPITPTIQGEIVTPKAATHLSSLPGSGAVTGGLILWAWGFFGLPWATVNCTQAPILLGSCGGLPVTSALQVGLLVLRSAFDPSAALYAITGLLVMGALAILIAVWRRDITRTLCAWTSAWLAFALVCAVLAISGVQQVISNPLAFNLEPGDWRGDMGVLIVFLALLLVGIGLIPLWAVAVRAAQRRDAAQRAAGL